jgi:exonuclease III
VAAWNANSITSKRHELECFLQANKIDIAAISETKLLPKYRYSVYWQDRNQLGGVVLLLVNNNIQHDQYLLPTPERLESIAASIHLHNNKQLLFVSTYLPPASSISSTDLANMFAACDSGQQ